MFGETLGRLLVSRQIGSIDEMDMSVAKLLPASDLLGLDVGADIISRAIDENKRILIVGDFDCDGATSTTLMVRCLREMGADVQFLVPDRFKFGYGLTPQIVEHGAEEFDPKLIITVDNGISSHDGVAKADELGIDVVITDHHLTTSSSPKASAVINPNQVGCEFGSKWLVGVGVAFYVMGRVAKIRREMGKSTTQVAKYLDLVALGTIADVGHLDQNNRILVTHGLNAIREGRCCVGILALLEQAGRDVRKITADDFGFAIAPRINAAGRMDNMRTGVECLLTDDFGEAHRLAIELNRLNHSRRAIEIQMRDEASSIIDELHLSDESDDKPKCVAKAICLYQDNWHQGVIGIVAGRIKEQLYRPTIVFAPADADKVCDDDLIKGSGRSIAGVHIRDAIETVAMANPELILHFGGHAMAAGLTIHKRDFERFKAEFLKVVDGFDDELFSKLKYTDGVLTPPDFSLAFVHALKNVSVWGNGFLPPAFDGVFEVVNFRILKDKHLKLTLRADGVQYPIDAIWFNYDVDEWDYRASAVHILFTLDINEWQGNQSLQLIIKDLAVCAID
ncbi:single-stranded-DNA-specific exonuclease RecJ [Moraxella bovis]|uniref:single-stranded-DNA-specific exonuclease RecJ n=1 Tax=Moraxella bovis TaxID=476 RepID=UPI002228077B|nr:single-stranded-DNA-specific exonuclease RecJ [Moraxella bovis]UYZ69687.1 single-stranded-DNA-specific exonuclease RecJ [Moraxella bovis]UYZ72067.1 single-stranded-DNA-specific exonuclease RecJ [Moraxella bovis]UYZ74365.1 single-stranded-DNA-specific exonuclease RecJ [Moraxella bovis]UZA15378.1 single-stranded-DNA-specific exonuclease RecJ [Moraxella bovis]UZA28648.1 single-stranded-DNA-specific exonuclease RecJ [Moraxella bovis]